MAELGFGPIMAELLSMVEEYIAANEIQTTFKNGKPGYDWLSSFMKRQKLTLKKGGQMQIARKNVTSDPFVVYGFYEMLENEVKRLGIQDKPECFYNCDESGFPSDPSRWKHIGPKGKKSIQVTCGANRENTTVLAVCCADGSALDPLIIFKGKNFQNTWRGTRTLPGTFYAVSDSGWMMTSIFENWFKLFTKTVKVRPILLLYDGHMTHTSLNTMQLAIKEGISLVKLPAHCTDLLQPLDVCCFNPLKSYYEEELTKHVHATGGREPLKKADFCNLIGSIWKKGLSEKNIKSGFRTTGIYPVSSDQYERSRLDKVKLKTYHDWKSNGSPRDSDGGPIIEKLENDAQKKVPTQVAPREIRSGDQVPSCSQNIDIDFDTDSSFASVTSSISTICSTPNPETIANPAQLLRKLQKHAPKGMKYALTLVPTEEEICMEMILKNRKQSLKTDIPPAKRHKVNSMHGCILTDAECVQQMQKRAKEEEEKNQAKEKRKAERESKSSNKAIKVKKTKTKKKKRKNKIDDGDSSDEWPEHGHRQGKYFRQKLLNGDFDKEGDDHSDNGSEDEIHSQVEDNDEVTDPVTKPVAETVAESVTNQDIMKELDDHNVGKFFAVFWPKPCTYYWAQLQKIFSNDPDEDTDEVEVKFLRRKESSTSADRVLWDWPSKDDVGIVSSALCFAGPAKPDYTSAARGKSFIKFECEAEVMEKFLTMKRKK